MLYMMKRSMLSSQHAVDKKEDKFVDQVSKLFVAQGLVTMAQHFKISAEEMELKLSHLSNAEMIFYKTIFFKH